MDGARGAGLVAARRAAVGAGLEGDAVGAGAEEKYKENEKLQGAATRKGSRSRSWTTR